MNQPGDNQNSARFVVLFHQFPDDHERTNHWDLMLEDEAELLTWSIDATLEPGKTVAAVRLPNHRKAYLDYEGQVSGDRGSVTRVMEGEYSWDSQSDRTLAVLEFDVGHMKIEFLGKGEQLQIVVT